VSGKWQMANGKWQMVTVECLPAEDST